MTVRDWLVAFLATVLIEVAVAVPLLGHPGATDSEALSPTIGRRAAAVVLAQLATHPIVWFVWPAIGLSRLPFLLLAEGWALSAEIGVYRLVFPTLPASRALAVSALANGLSCAAALALTPVMRHVSGP